MAVLGSRCDVGGGEWVARQSGAHQVLPRDRGRSTQQGRRVGHERGMRRGRVSAKAGVG